MSSSLAPFPARVRIVNADGTPSAEFVRWLERQLGVRVGGSEALTNTELADAVNEQQFGPQPIALISQDDVIPVSRTEAERIDADGRLSALEAQVMQLQREVQDLQQRPNP